MLTGLKNLTISQSTSSEQDLYWISHHLTSLTAVQLSYVDPYPTHLGDDNDFHPRDYPSSAASFVWPLLPLQELGLYTATTDYEGRSRSKETLLYTPMLLSLMPDLEDPAVNLHGLTSLRLEQKMLWGFDLAIGTPSDVANYFKDVFSSLPGLKQLTLWQIDDPDGWLRVMLGSVRDHCKQLTDLECGGFKIGAEAEAISDWCADIIGGMTQLKRLSIAGCHVQDVGMCSLLGQLPDLESLSIVREEHVSCRSLEAVGQLTNLTHLTLAELRGVAEAVVVDLSCLFSLLQLRQLIMLDCLQLDEYDSPYISEVVTLRAALRAGQQSKLGKVLLLPLDSEGS